MKASRPITDLHAYRQRRRSETITPTFTGITPPTFTNAPPPERGVREGSPVKPPVMVETETEFSALCGYLWKRQGCFTWKTCR